MHLLAILCIFLEKQTEMVLHRKIGLWSIAILILNFLIHVHAMSSTVFVSSFISFLKIFNGFIEK